MPAWIHPLRLTTIDDANIRVSGICSHLEASLSVSPISELATVTLPPYAGIESGIQNRSEVQNCANHAKLIAFALGWVMENNAMKHSIVIEAHCAQSSGAADLVLLNGTTVWLFEAGAGIGSNVEKKHKKDVALLRTEEKSLLLGKLVTEVQRYRVIRTEALGDLPLAARNAVVIKSACGCITRC